MRKLTDPGADQPDRADPTGARLSAERAELFGDIALLASSLERNLPADREGLVLVLQAAVAQVRLGTHVRLNLQKVAAVALHALERHDALQAPAPAAAYRLRQLVGEAARTSDGSPFP